MGLIIGTYASRLLEKTRASNLSILAGQEVRATSGVAASLRGMNPLETSEDLRTPRCKRVKWVFIVSKAPRTEWPNSPGRLEVSAIAAYWGLTDVTHCTKNNHATQRLHI